MFYLVSLFPLAFFYNHDQRFFFYLKIIILVHIYREVGRFFVSVTRGLPKGKRLYSEYPEFSNLSHFSFEIIFGLSVLTFSYYLASWIDRFTGFVFFKYFIPSIGYSFALVSLFRQIRFWLKPE